MGSAFSASNALGGSRGCVAQKEQTILDLAGSAGCWSWWWCWELGGAAGKGTSIDPNRLAKVKRGDVARSVVATGKIQPITKVEVKCKASGIVEKLYVDINNQVHKGQELAQLDQQEILAQVEAQRAQLPPPRPTSPPSRPTSSRTR